MTYKGNYYENMQKELRIVLSDNLKRLMDQKPGKLSQAEVGRRGTIPQRTVGRIKNAEVDATMGNLQSLAKAFKLQPWQLLVPEFDPASPPMLRAMNEHERALYDRLHAALRAIENR